MGSINLMRWALVYTLDDDLLHRCYSALHKLSVGTVEAHTIRTAMRATSQSHFDFAVVDLRLGFPGTRRLTRALYRRNRCCTVLLLNCEMAGSEETIRAMAAEIRHDSTPPPVL